MTARGRCGPHPIVSVAAALAATAALWPSGLPRSAMVSAVVTAGCVAVVTASVLMATRRSPARPATIVAAGAGSLGFACCAALLSMSWQNGLRDALGAPAVGSGWAAVSVTGGLLAFVAIVWLPRITALVVAMTVALLAGFLPAAQADDPADQTPDVPAGIFYAQNDSNAQNDDMSALHRDAAAQRSADLVTRWVRAGGLDRRAVVIAVPTGSGWVDAAAVAGYRRRFGGRRHGGGDAVFGSAVVADVRRRPVVGRAHGDRAAAGGARPYRCPPAGAPTGSPCLRTEPGCRGRRDRPCVGGPDTSGRTHRDGARGDSG
ncbi:MAG: hypothetical protein SW127_00100 [Actinomycetota bacterium]|nr:hypothetical protein [Actinomycetota bacterium]